MSTPAHAIATRDANGAASDLIEEVVIQGNLANLTPQQRASYYARVCQSVGLNPLTRPLEYLTLNGKLILYARKDATDQIRNLRRISTVIVARERHDDLYVVTARATTPDGRTDESIGAVPIGGLKGEALANALMKAESKAKRRVTLSIAGMGILDELEVGTIADARPANVDADGVIHDRAPTPAPTPPVDRPLLAEALDLAWRCRGARLTPTQPTATATDAQLRRWMDHWAPKLTEAEARSEQAPDSVIEGIEPEVIWDHLGDDADPEPEAEPTLPLEVSGPRWANSPLGRDVSAVADQLTEAGKRFSRPPDDATEAELTGWLSSKRALLGQRGAK